MGMGSVAESFKDQPISLVLPESFSIVEISEIA
jgi:hypothetical protein